MSNIKKSRTTHIRVFKSDLDEIRLKFPNISMASFFHQSVRTNPFIQLEAGLRKNVQKTKKK